jgi:hypothetical protein
MFCRMPSSCCGSGSSAFRARQARRTVLKVGKVTLWSVDQRGGPTYSQRCDGRIMRSGRRKRDCGAAADLLAELYIMRLTLFLKGRGVQGKRYPCPPSPPYSLPTSFTFLMPTKMPSMVTSVTR